MTTARRIIVCCIIAPIGAVLATVVFVGVLVLGGAYSILDAGKERHV